MLPETLAQQFKLAAEAAIEARELALSSNA